jgi:hypothetical protein
MSRFEDPNSMTRNSVYEDSRSVIISFCDRTNNDKDYHEDYYDNVDEYFL